MPHSRQFCTFTVGGLFLGIAVEHVQEVLRAQPMTRVPLAPPTIAGLINLRGQIVTAIDLRRRLALPHRPGNEPPMNVVVRDRDNAISLLVDRIGDVIEVEEGTCEPPPATVQPNMQRLILGTYKLADRLLLALDIEHLLSDGEPVATPEPLLAC